uniref:Uncharacterized protein n=1 Tax=Rhizophora mucronata TaxID=61149 RepID=A0A2P2LFT9_RHIMU
MITFALCCKNYDHNENHNPKNDQKQAGLHSKDRLVINCT